MPTAAKLAAAILFAGLAWVVSGLVVPLLPEGTDVSAFIPVNAAIGAAMGWFVAGPSVRTTLTGVLSFGLTASIGTVLVALFLHSFAIMIRQSLRKLYDGPVDALLGVLQIMMTNGRLIATSEIVLTVLVGGVVAGLATEMVGRRWR